MNEVNQPLWRNERWSHTVGITPFMKSEPRSYFGNSEYIPNYWPGLWSRWKGQLSLGSMRLSSKRKEKEDKDTYHNGRSVLRETPQLHGDWSGEFGIYKANMVGHL